MSEPKPMPTYWALAEEVTYLHGHLDKLQAENAKLRELLAETLMDVHEYAEKYGIESSYDAVNEHLDARMRELGIEVKP